MGLGIHAMDHLLHLLGDWAEVRAQAATLDREIEVEDVSMAMVRFASGALASVVNSALSPRQETYIRLDYQRATIELTHLYGYTRDNWKFTPPTRTRGQRAHSGVAEFSADTGSTHCGATRRVRRQHGRRHAALTSGADARRTLELLTAIYKSAFTGQPVTRGSIGRAIRFILRCTAASGPNGMLLRSASRRRPDATGPRAPPHRKWLTTPARAFPRPACDRLSTPAPARRARRAPIIASGQIHKHRMQRRHIEHHAGLRANHRRRHAISNAK